jgi:hypothetical protein
MHLLRNVILAIGLGGLAVGAFACGGGSKSEETTPAATEPAPAEEGAGEAAPEGETPAEGEAAPADDTGEQGGEQPAEGGEQEKSPGGK